jgi:thiamine-phosphate pyrophosphorylase
MARAIDYALYLVTDRAAARGRGLIEIVRAAVQGGASVVQLRDKDASTRDTLGLALELKALLDPLGVPLILNDRLDLALACGAAGVHLGQDDLPCDLARRLVGAECLLGVSVSTPEEARRATGEGADYLGVSPVFDTPTKRDTPTATGLAGLAAIRAVTHLPLIAIGGLNERNAGPVMAAGADGIAVVSALMAAEDPAAAARALRLAIARGRTSPARLPDFLGRPVTQGDRGPQRL